VKEREREKNHKFKKQLMNIRKRKREEEIKRIYFNFAIMKEIICDYERARKKCE
jgi:hypothetical protein